MARTFSIDIKGKKTIASVKDILKKIDIEPASEIFNIAIKDKVKGNDKIEKMKGLAHQMAVYISTLVYTLTTQALCLKMNESSISVATYWEEYLNNELKSVKKELQKLRMILAVIKMGKILSNTWFDGLNLTDTGEYTFTKNNDTMVIKLDRKKVYF